MNDPNVSDWIAHRADESDGDHEVTESEPVGPVKEKRVTCVRIEQTSVNGLDPLLKMRTEKRAGVNDAIEEPDFTNERNGGGATDKQATD